MSLQIKQGINSSKSFPRSRGDEPLRELVDLVRTAFSPLTRG